MTWQPGRQRLAGYAGLAVLAVAGILFVSGGPGGPDQPAADEPGAVSVATPAATPTNTPAPSPVPTDATGPAPTPPAQPTDGPLPSEPVAPVAKAAVALVPVTGFWSPDVTISSEELALALTGRSEMYPRVIVPAGDEAAVEEYLGGPLAATVETGEAAAIERAVRRGALGLMHVSDVTPRVRALAVDGVSLFGNGRLTEVDDWPLLVRGAGDSAVWEQAASWTMVAGGDIQLDRWMAYQVRSLDKGVDWPWDGGRVEITGRQCCSDLGHRVPLWQRTSDEGEVRALFAGADLALANLEAAAVDDPALWRLAPDFRLSLSFSGDPRLLEGLRSTGFDFLSLANNHIHNAGSAGIRDTRRHLEELGIAFAGAGRDAAQAGQPAQLEAAGQGVVVLPCATVGRLALADRAGAASCFAGRFSRQISEASAAGNVVIVFPHWGREYRATPNASQRALAQSWVAAGADIVLGAHPHWAGAVEEIDDALVFYSLGNLAFDQPWSEATMQGVIVELTFQADRLVQAWLHPTLIVDDVQPNLLDYDAGGRRVIKRMRDASAGLFPD
jgi:hypothetical protein